MRRSDRGASASGAALAAFASLSVACGSSSASPSDGGALRDATSADVSRPDVTAPFDARSDAPADDAGVDAPCAVGGDGGYVTAPYQNLSQYCLVSIADGGIQFAPSVVPYALNTPLFSDYAVKVRGVWLPPGEQATYSDAGPMDFPVGTILTKSFGFADDLRKAQPHVTWVETRLVIRTGAGYSAYTYVWDQAQREAVLTYGGEVRPLTWTGNDGGTVSTDYLVPSFNQCKQCHNVAGVVTPIGPKARQLNRDFDYPDGGENQLAHWARIGILSGAPDAAAAPKLPVWNDPSTGSVEQRARAYLEGNCAHCHNPEGTAFTTGLFLPASETTPTAFGVCKPPVAAGAATGGASYDVVPGAADASIMVHRLSSTDPGVMMPQIGRSLVDVPGVALVREWIDGLDGGCQ